MSSRSPALRPYLPCRLRSRFRSSSCSTTTKPRARFGVGAVAARQFLWFQRFTPADTDFDLREIWVLFPQDPEIIAGVAVVQLVVYQDDDGNPTNGARLLYTADERVQFADDLTFSIYPLNAPIEIRGGGDVLIGVVNRFVASNVTSLNAPATHDTNISQQRSWVATWIADPPDRPVLPSDQDMFLVDSIAGGNWMIRGFGNAPAVIDVPTLDARGFAVMVVLLLGLGWTTLRRNQ